MKNRTFIFGAVSSLLIIAFMFITNFLTSWGHPWFIYPTFVVLWWPLSVYFAGNRNFKVFSVAGFLLIAVFFILVNLFTSPGYLWCVYPIYAALWWPLSMYLCGARKFKLYSIIMSALTIVFFLIVNLISSPGVMWFFYPGFAVALWPLSMYFARRKYIKLYAVLISLAFAGFFALVNYLYTPQEIWWTETLFYLAWWPVIMLLGDRAKSRAFSIVGALVLIAYFVAYYFMKTPGEHPWYLYTILPVLWWPVTYWFKDKTHTKTFLGITMGLFIAYYGVLNLLYSPNYFWLIYLIYAASWAVMGEYFSTRKKFFAFSICAAIVTIVFFSLVNYMNSPNHIWAVYPSFAIIWWPLGYYFFKVRNGDKGHSQAA